MPSEVTFESQQSEGAQMSNELEGDRAPSGGDSLVSLELLALLGPMVPALVPMLAPEADSESPSSTNPGPAS